MSDPLEAALPPAPGTPPTEARAAQLAKFRREQLIVDTLNRGVSVAEIAVRIGVGEKRTRAIIREVLARRMPHPPEEFVAIQVSRLNEALLVAYSAMSPTNPEAVDQVVKIVRELDRYGGAFAAESRLDAPAEEAGAFDAAWTCQAELTCEWGDDRPENPLQSLEKVESAPGIAQDPLAPLQRGEGWGEGPGRLAVGARQAPHPNLFPENGEKGRFPAGDPRPRNLPQSLDNIESAPGNGRLVAAPSGCGASIVSPSIPPRRPGTRPHERLYSVPSR